MLTELVEAIQRCEIRSIYMYKAVSAPLPFSLSLIQGVEWSRGPWGLSGTISTSPPPLVSLPPLSSVSPPPPSVSVSQYGYLRGFNRILMHQKANLTLMKRLRLFLQSCPPPSLDVTLQTIIVKKNDKVSLNVMGYLKSHITEQLNFQKVHVE